jgi:hypothetical protein
VKRLDPTAARIRGAADVAGELPIHRDDIDRVDHGRERFGREAVRFEQDARATATQAAGERSHRCRLEQRLSAREADETVGAEIESLARCERIRDRDGIRNQTLLARSAAQLDATLRCGLPGVR